MRRLFYCCDSLSPGNGGIARVARLMEKAIAEEQESGSLVVSGAVFHDNEVPADTKLRMKACEGVRWRFALEVQAAGVRHRHFVYDFVGMARAHALLRVMRFPFLVWIHGIEVWEGARTDRLLWAGRANTLLANSEYTKRRACALYSGLEHAQVCWLGTETDSAPHQTRRRDDRPRVLIVGRMDDNQYKGHQELIGCWRRVTSCVPDAVLTIVGTGPAQAKYARLAKELGCNDTVELRGFVSEGSLEDLWAGTTVFAMPSRGEGFGLVYIEAMRHSIPIIASVHDAAPEINLEGKTGFNVDLAHGEDLCERLVYLLRNPSEATRLGANGFRRWQENFTYTCFKQRFLPALRGFLET